MQAMRPRFELSVPFGPEEVHQRLQSRLACAGCPCQAIVVGRHVEVMIREDLSHFWSPRLTLDVNEHPEGALLDGLFGPNPNVWTLFVAAYAFLVLSASFSGVFGLVQLSLGQSPWGLWVGGASAALLCVPYAGSLLGQRLAAEQMELLRCFLQEILTIPHARSTSTQCPPAPADPARKLPLAHEG